ncbi:MAG: hypothetical protein WC575_00995 [Patescibacteria group bacterium]
MNKTSIFILEENIELSVLLRDILQDEGCDVTTMDDEKEALEMLKLIYPDVVISNAKGRLGFIQNTRKLLPEVIILLVTGGDINRREYESLVDVIMDKPVDITTVISKIRELLKKKQSALSA